MKTRLATLVFASLSLMIHSSYCETPVERDLNLLIKQREKAQADAMAPIDARFKTAADQLLRRATQAGDLEGAMKVKAAMESIAPPPAAVGVKSARKDLAGTTWNAVPGGGLRGGFAATLKFTETTVEPGGYRYEVDNHNTVTVTFTGGDKQVLKLTKAGKRLEFSNRNSEYAYEIATE